MSTQRFAWCTWALLLLLAESVAAGPTSPIADAAEQKNFDFVRAMLEAGVDVDSPQSDGMTALHWAVYHNDLDAAERLLEAGANAQVVSEYGVMPLSLACLNGNTKIVELLLDATADPNTRLPGGETALMTASRTGWLGPVRELIERGADVNAQERNGQTALMWAAAEGHVQVVDRLLQAGADWRTTLNSGFTALSFAVREGRTDVVLRLLETEANVDDEMRLERIPGMGRNIRTNALLLAVENGHFELAVELLAAGGVDLNGHPSGYTALHAMTWVRKPIRGDGDPPPIGSGKLNSLEFVRQLVAAGADVDARLERGTSGRGQFTTTGSTPFLLAARASDVPLMRLLVELGADPKSPNADNSPPLLAATGVGALGDGDESAGTEAEAVAAVRLLLDLGADVNAVDNNGETAMHGAAYQSRVGVVKLLANNGADVSIWNRKNKWGWTPLLIAEGHRPGNFRPAPDTIAAIRDVMVTNGVVPPESSPEPETRDDYSNDGQ